MGMVFSANRSSVLIDGEAVAGLQSLTYRVVSEREDVRAVGTRERVGVVFGLRSVVGEIVLKSVHAKLDTLLDQQTKFQIVASLKSGEAESDPKRSIAFDDCFVDGKAFLMEASGVPVTTYSFTATRVREE